jgi:hypothetical protein
VFRIIFREWWFHVCAPYTSIQMEYVVHKPWGASSYYLEHPFGLIIISLFNFFFGLFDCSLHLLTFIHRVILFCLQSLNLNIVWFPSNIFLCMCMCFHLFLLDMHTILEGLSLYWPSKFFAHFGNICQWRKSFEGLKRIEFYALVLFFSIYLACFAWFSI